MEASRGSEYGTPFFSTPDNGWWEAHLHFAIYTGPWQGTILPGYWKKGQGRTKKSYWKDPSAFITTFPA